MKKPEISAEEIADYAFQNFMQALVWINLTKPETICDVYVGTPDKLGLQHEYKASTWEPLFLAKVKEVREILESNYKEYLEEV